MLTLLPTPTAPETTARDRHALAFYVGAMRAMVEVLERNRWAHDDPHVGPHHAVLALARADLDAAEAAATAAHAMWVRELVS